MIKQRNTKQRRLVMDTLLALANHPSADQIYLAVRELDPKISRGTVYRNLNLLSENGEILHILLPGIGADRFDHRTDHHYHVICTQCGAICDCALPYRDLDDAKTADETGFVITRHRTVFEGLCPTCAQSEKKRA